MKKLGTKVWLAGSVLLLGAIAVFVASLEDTAQVAHKPPRQQAPVVSVVSVPVSRNAGIIRTFAEVRPRWNTALRSPVSGRVVEVTDKAYPGQPVETGDLLVRIEEDVYLLEVQEAERAVLAARIEVNRQQAKAKVARSDWERADSVGVPAPLALNLPQLDLARRVLKVEQGRLRIARKRLADTRILAPFSGLITARDVSLGQYVSEGDTLVQIIDNTHRDIAVSLNPGQWRLLAENWRGRVVVIRDAGGVDIGRARIARGGGFLDPKTRQYRVFLTVENTPDSGVLPGEYVEIDLPTRAIPDTLRIPQTALTREGDVWFVDGGDRLRRFSARVLFYDGAQIIVRRPQTDGGKAGAGQPWRIATTPLASFLAGTAVTPKLKADP